MAVSEEYEQDFKNTQSNELTPNAPPYQLDKEIQDKQSIDGGAPTLSLHNFIDDLLIKVKPSRDSTPLPMFYALVEEYGLVIYDKPLDRIKEGKIISPRKIAPSIELLGTLRQREQQANKSFDDDSFQFWETLDKESKYTVFRDDVAMAYDCASKSQFPWLNMDNALVWLNVGEHTLENVRSKAKQVNELSSENIEDIIGKSVPELLALLRCKSRRKRALVAVADSEEEVIQLLHELEGLKDFKKKLETERCRVKKASYQFEESRTADIKRISAQITELDEWLDNYRTTGKLEVIEQEDEIEPPKSEVKAVPAMQNKKPWLIEDPADPEPEQPCTYLPVTLHVNLSKTIYPCYGNVTYWLPKLSSR